MRDLLKSKQYFDKYLSVNAARIDKYEKLLTTLSSDNFEGRKTCNAFIAVLYRNKIVALYSSGADITTIKNIYPSFAKYFAVSADETYGYYDIIDLLALAVLLDAKECVPDVKKALNQVQKWDFLIDTLMHSLEDSWEIGYYSLNCDWFLEFSKCPEDKRSDYLKQYLSKKWYKTHKDAAWYDSHKLTTETYNGYWSFEVGAVAKLYSVTDNKDWPYYPYDMVHSTI